MKKELQQIHGSIKDESSAGLRDAKSQVIQIYMSANSRVGYQTILHILWNSLDTLIDGGDNISPEQRGIMCLALEALLDNPDMSFKEAMDWDKKMRSVGLHTSVL